MSRTPTTDAIVIQRHELKELIRKVRREELTHLVTMPDEDWEIEEDSLVWQDLVELKQDAREGRLRLYARKDAWRE